MSHTVHTHRIEPEKRATRSSAVRARHIPDGWSTNRKLSQRLAISFLGLTATCLSSWLHVNGTLQVLDHGLDRNWSVYEVKLTLPSLLPSH